MGKNLSRGKPRRRKVDKMHKISSAGGKEVADLSGIEVLDVFGTKLQGRRVRPLQLDPVEGEFAQPAVVDGIVTFCTDLLAQQPEVLFPGSFQRRQVALERRLGSQFGPEQPDDLLVRAGLGQLEGRLALAVGPPQVGERQAGGDPGLVQQRVQGVGVAGVKGFGR